MIGDAQRELLASPAFAFMLTVLVWAGAMRLSRVSRTVFNPVLVSVVAIVALLVVFDLDYDTYSSGVAPLVALLGPAIVALALPLRRNRRLIAANIPAIVTATIGGSLAGVFATVGIATAMGLDAVLVNALTPKHATSAVSASLASATGGLPSLAAVLSVVTGVLGAVLAVPLLRAVRWRDPLVMGVSLGVSAHAIGTARAFDENPVTGSMASVGMALAAIVVPVIVTASTLIGLL